MDERGEVHELHDGADAHGALLGTSLHRAREEHECGAEQFAPHSEEVSAHLLDHRKVGADDPVHLCGHHVEASAHGRLDLTQRIRAAGGSDATHRTARSTSAIRSATSRNVMSTTNTR